MAAHVRGPGGAWCPVALDAGRVPQPGRPGGRPGHRLDAARGGHDPASGSLRPGRAGRAWVRDGQAHPVGAVGHLRLVGTPWRATGEPGAGPDAVGAGPRRIARALSVEEMRAWLALLDESEFAQRRDLPELARFMLATGLRLGEALGVTWADIDLDAGTVAVQRTIVRVTGPGAGRQPGEVPCLRAGFAAAAVVRASCCGLAGCAWVPSRGRFSRMPVVAGATVATWGRRFVEYARGPSSSGSRPTPTARPWRHCSTRADRVPG